MLGLSLHPAKGSVGDAPVNDDPEVESFGTCL